MVVVHNQLAPFWHDLPCRAIEQSALKSGRTWGPPVMNLAKRRGAGEARGGGPRVAVELTLVVKLQQRSMCSKLATLSLFCYRLQSAVSNDYKWWSSLKLASELSFKSHVERKAVIVTFSGLLNNTEYRWSSKCHLLIIQKFMHLWSSALLSFNLFAVLKHLKLNLHNAVILEAGESGLVCWRGEKKKSS